MNKETRELVEAWDELDDRCPDCGGMESHCEEVGCLSEEWTDEDTIRYQQGVKQ